MGHSLRIIDGTASRCDDGVLRVNSAQNLIFNLTEGFVSFPVDDILQAPPCHSLNHQVSVDEVLLQDFRHNDTGGGLSCPGHTNENDVAALCPDFFIRAQ